jgi:4-amino-4-deoxy-L-arabinose transferase-like glycosyltransferase
VIVALALVLYAWGINTADLRNTFFSIAVRSMSKSFQGFVFGSFDTAGIMAIDKPPMAFWPQVVSVWIFGYHSWSLVLPQVLEGAAAVFLLHRTVRRWAGENVALLAALILALTPITVVINRTNNTDTLLVLWCVAAAYATVRAIDPQASPRSARLWLMQAALWVGCAFTTKMLAGWLVLPSLVLAYLIGRRAGWARRTFDLLWAAGVLAVSSLWWVTLTTLWPGDKPYTAGSADGTTWNLIFVQNGIRRIVGVSESASSGQGGHQTLSPAAANVVTIGKAIGAAFNGGALGLSAFSAGSSAGRSPGCCPWRCSWSWSRWCPACKTGGTAGRSTGSTPGSGPCGVRGSSCWACCSAISRAPITRTTRRRWHRRSRPWSSVDWRCSGVVASKASGRCRWASC